ncbi:MAG TPA: Spy/CpxP family protein refolding chaperone [Ramlibacter sp.]|nr:Spy/CpxP family protein refolding chaperone [Ramlibacter sp.]
MKSIRPTLVAAALLAALAGTAGAQTPPAQPGAAATSPAHEHAVKHGRMDPARMQARHAERMNQLKQKLQITSAQEGAWNSFVTALAPPANVQRPDRDALSRMTTPDRIDQMRALRSQRNAEMDRRADATKAFYAQLAPAQQKTFDDATARIGRGHHGHGMRHG